MTEMYAAGGLKSNDCETNVSVRKKKSVEKMKSLDLSQSRPLIRKALGISLNIENDQLD